jgi:hypothetical protein
MPRLGARRASKAVASRSMASSAETCPGAVVTSASASAAIRTGFCCVSWRRGTTETSLDMES